MGQAVLRVEGLPEGALDAAAAFHAEWLPKARAFLDPPRDGEGDHPEDGGGGLPPAQSLADESPLRQPDGLPPPRPGEDLVLIFPAASFDHRAWRLAAVQDLARVAAPRRVNALVGDQGGGLAAAVEWLAHASGITGQLLAVD